MVVGVAIKTYKTDHDLSQKLVVVALLMFSRCAHVLEILIHLQLAARCCFRSYAPFVMIHIVMTAEDIAERIEKGPCYQPRVFRFSHRINQKRSSSTFNNIQE